MEYLESWTYKRLRREFSEHEDDGLDVDFPPKDVTDSDRVADAKQALHAIIIDPNSTNPEKINASRTLLAFGVEGEGWDQDAFRVKIGLLPPEGDDE